MSIKTEQLTTQELIDSVRGNVTFDQVEGEMFADATVDSDLLAACIGRLITLDNQAGGNAS